MIDQLVSGNLEKDTAHQKGEIITDGEHNHNVFPLSSFHTKKL